VPLTRRFEPICLREWIDIPRDDDQFVLFLSLLLDVIESEIAPAPAESCPWCRHRKVA
jgi:hypothetical protein